MAVVVAQLADRVLMLTEVRSSNPVIDKILHRTYFTLEGKEIKKKRPGIDDFYPNKQKRFCAERKAH